MTIVNIRGTSGSGKSTLVHRFLEEHPHEPILGRLSDWKNPKIIGYKCEPTRIRKDYHGWDQYIDKLIGPPTYIIGRYETQCGGCDSMSYKGSHTDIENLIRSFFPDGNVIFEGLTISSTITRWLRISEENPGTFVWAFMNTTEEECYRRIIARSGREPKRDAKGLADYNRKHHGCIVQMNKLKALNENVIEIGSDDAGYKKLLEVLNGNNNNL